LENSKFAVSIERPKVKSVSASRGLCLPAPWPGTPLLDPAGGTASRHPSHIPGTYIPETSIWGPPNKSLCVTTWTLPF